MATMIHKSQSDTALLERPLPALPDPARVDEIIKQRRSSGFAKAQRPTGAHVTRQLAGLAGVLAHARRRRCQSFSDIAFGEPAWDMMLDLYAEQAAGRGVVVSSLTVAAGVPQSTALRWINTLVRKGHFIRRRDPADARRVHVSLSPELVVALEAHLWDLWLNLRDLAAIDVEAGGCGSAG